MQSKEQKRRRFGLENALAVYRGQAQSGDESPHYKSFTKIEGEIF
jgi:hypothetical protein